MRSLRLGAADANRELHAQPEPAWRQIVFRDEVRDADLDGLLEQLLVLAAGDEHDRHEVAHLPQLARELDARHARKVLVEQQAVELAILDDRERLLRVARLGEISVESALFDGTADRQPIDQVVIDD